MSADNYFTTAANQNQKTRDALLEAIRNQGSQAKAAFDQAQAGMVEQQRSALSAALGDRSMSRAPGGFAAQVAQTVNAPTDRRLADLQASSASRQAAFGQQSAAAGTYMDEANAAIPVLKQRQQEQTQLAQSELAQKQAQLAADAQDRGQQRALQLVELQQRIADRQSAAEKPRTASQILADQFGGEDGFTAYVRANAPALGAPSRTAGRDGTVRIAPPLNELEVAEKVATGAGLPKGLGLSLYAKSQEKQAGRTPAPNPDIPQATPAPSKAEVDKVKNTRAYKDALAAARAARDAGLSPEEFDARMKDGMVADYKHDFPNTRSVVRRMYEAGVV